MKGVFIPLGEESAKISLVTFDADGQLART